MSIHNQETLRDAVRRAVRDSVDVAILIPALNEESSLPHTLSQLRAQCERLTEVTGRQVAWRAPLVVDNGSHDRTAEVAQEAGALVISESRRGYGRACLTGIEHLNDNPPQVLLFVDADGSDDLSDLDRLLAPLLTPPFDTELVIGSRAKLAEPGALTPLQRFGNALSCLLIRLAFKVRFTDLGPLRIINWEALERLQMEDQDFGWTVEMQAKAAARGVKCAEVDVRYLPRYAGESKISGTLIGSYRAGVKILSTIARIWWSQRGGCHERAK